METVRKIIAECPIGRVVEVKTIDMFGFIFERKLVKETTRAWRAFNALEIGRIEEWSTVKPYMTEGY